MLKLKVELNFRPLSYVSLPLGQSIQLNADSHTVQAC